MTSTRGRITMQVLGFGSRVTSSYSEIEMSFENQLSAYYWALVEMEHLTLVYPGTCVQNCLLWTESCQIYKVIN